MIINDLTTYEVEVLGIEADPFLCLNTRTDPVPYHRCHIRWGAGTGGGTLDSENAKTMTFVFSSRKDLVATHRWIGQRGISCTRIPGLKLVVKVPYHPFECCLAGGMWPPRKVSLRIRKKKFMTREEKRYWRRQWGSKSERESKFESLGRKERRRILKSEDGRRRRRRR